MNTKGKCWKVSEVQGVSWRFRHPKHTLKEGKAAGSENVVRKRKSCGGIKARSLVNGKQFSACYPPKQTITF